MPEHLMLPTDELAADERRALIASMRPDDAEGVPELAEVDVPPDLREEIETAMSRYPQLRSASIPALWAVQRHYGWCSPEGLRQAAAVMGVTPAYLESVASFYDMLYTSPRRPPQGARLPKHLLLDERRRRICSPRSARPRRRRHEAGPGRAPRTASSSSPGPSASEPATSRRWRLSTSATTARSTPATRWRRSTSFAPAPRCCRARRSSLVRPPVAPSPSRIHASWR